MKNLRIFFSVLLALSVLVPLTMPQLALGQSVTMITSIQYFTTSSPTTAHSTVQTTIVYSQAARYLMTPPDYNNKTGSFSLGQEEIITSETRFGDGQDSGCRYYDYFLTNATAGQEIRGHFEVVKSRFESVVRSIDFFILNLDQLQAFKGSRCGYGNWVWLMHVLTSSYDLNWIAPQSGEYALLFFSRDSYFHYNFYGDYLYFMAKVYSPTIQSSSVAFTSTRTYTIQSSQVIVSTLQDTSPPPSTTNYYIVAFIAAIIVGLIIIIGRSKWNKAK